MDQMLLTANRTGVCAVEIDAPLWGGVRRSIMLAWWRGLTGARSIRLVIFLLGATVLASPVLADVVVPSADVTDRVVVRASASSQSAQVGSLTPGQQAELVGSVPNWHEIRLSN